MNAIPADAKIMRRETVIANDLSDTETVMLDIDRGLYFGVKDVGKVIWSELGQPTTIDNLCSVLMQQYDVDDETCRREVVEFITYLVGREMVDVHPNDAP